MSKRNRGLDLFSGMLIGSAVGVALSLLYAPQSGKKIRKDLRKKSDKLRREAESRLSHAQRDVEALLHETKKRSEQLKSNIERTAESLTEKAGNLVEEGRGPSQKANGWKDWAAHRVRNLV